MKVRAKFVVESRKETVSGYELHLRAVTSGSAENVEFFKWTPNATVTLGTVNADAAAQFTPGVALYVDFIPVTEAT